MKKLRVGFIIDNSKPSLHATELIKFVLNNHGLDPKNLVFCDDNPFNVKQLVQDLNCKGCIITDTGIFKKFKNFHCLDSKVFKLSSCKL